MINHTQAQRIIQAALDGRSLSDQEWLALQRHLEECADCRAYQARLAHLDSSLSRQLKHEMSTRWSADGPRRDVAGRLIARQRRAQARRQVVGYFGLAAAVVLLLALLAGGGLLVPTPGTPDATGTPEQTPDARFTPAGGFSGQVAYVSRRDGNSEIYLLNTGYSTAPGLSGTIVFTQWIDPVNLTQHPGEDTDPAWSPDGEWLSFLSDRSGKREVYVMHVSGARLTQLTDAPQVEWQGPVSWSADGQRIALIGKDGAAGGLSWVYLLLPGSDIPGNRVLRLGYTSGASAVKFSPDAAVLVFQDGNYNRGGLMLYHLENMTYTQIAMQEIIQRQMRAGDGVAFDWSPDGRSLVYLAEGPFTDGQPAADAASEVRVTLEVTSRAPGVVPGSSAIAFADALEGFRGVSWSPWAGKVAALEDDGSGCWEIKLRPAAYPPEAAKRIEGFCVEAGLERANWQTVPTEDNGRWLVVSGTPALRPAGLYALHIEDPDQVERYENPQTVQLTADAEIAGAPRLRPALPDGRTLALDPLPAPAAEAARTAAPLPAELPGALLLADQNQPERGVTWLRPDGQERAQLAPPPTDGNYETICPAWSPDRTQIAFLSNRTSSASMVNEIFLMDADGQNLRQLSQPRFPLGLRSYEPDQPAFSLPRYNCPAWSPDGIRLAAVVQTAEAFYLALINTDGADPRFIRVGKTSYWTGVTWTPDGSGVVLMVPDLSEGAEAGTRLVLVDPARVSDDESGEGIQTLLTLPGRNDAIGTAFSPNGEQLAILALTHGREMLSASLLLADTARTPDGLLTVAEPRNVLEIPRYIPRWSSQALTWLLDGRIHLLAGRPTNEAVKAEIWRFDPATGQAQTLLQVDEIVLSAAWSPDGRWLAYSAESGMYLLDLEAGAGAVPARIADDAVLDMDW